MEEVTLRPITLSDTDDIVRWRNSDAVRQNMYIQDILTAEQHQNYYSDHILTGRTIQYIIQVNGISVGTVFIKYGNSNNGEIGIFIGEKDYRSRGIGRDALGKLLKTIGQRKDSLQLFAKVKISNHRAINLYRQLGFEKDCLKTDEGFLLMKHKI